MPTLGKRSAPKSTRMTTTDDGAVGESISRPWNVQACPLLLTLQSLLPSLGLNFFQTNLLCFSYYARAMSVYAHSFVNTASTNRMFSQYLVTIFLPRVQFPREPDRMDNRPTSLHGQ
jgi:hypothetical protein